MARPCREEIETARLDDTKTDDAAAETGADRAFSVDVRSRSRRRGPSMPAADAIARPGLSRCHPTFGDSDGYRTADLPRPRGDPGLGRSGAHIALPRVAAGHARAVGTQPHKQTRRPDDSGKWRSPTVDTRSKRHLRLP